MFFCTVLFRGQQDCQSHMFLAMSLRPKSMTNNNNNHDRDHCQPFTLYLLCAGPCSKFTLYSQQPTENGKDGNKKNIDIIEDDVLK